jgi:hypothetical protein
VTTASKDQPRQHHRPHAPPEHPATKSSRLGDGEKLIEMGPEPEQAEHRHGRIAPPADAEIGIGNHWEQTLGAGLQWV